MPTRRTFLTSAIATAAAASANAQFLNAPRHGLPGTLQERYAKLDAILAQPVFKRELFKDPVIIQSIELLYNKKQYLCRIRSKDGHEGISVSLISQASSEHSICFSVPSDSAARARVSLERTTSCAPSGP